MAPLETETKLLVSPGDYRQVLEAGTLLECTDQLNIYLHDPARVGERGETFRVRFETDRVPVATLKLPAGWEGEMRRMVEMERPLSEMGPEFHPRPRRWVDLRLDGPEGFVEHFRDRGITRLRRLGWMRNRRCRLELPPQGIIELDRYRLPGGEVIHEVEIEHPEEAVHHRLVERVRALAPSAEVTRMGKFSRFLRALGLPDAPE